MRSYGRAARAGLLICVGTALASCDGDEDAGTSGVTGGSSSGTGASGGSAGSVSTGGSGGSASGAGGSASGSGGAVGSGGTAGGSAGSGGSTDASGGSAGSSAGAGGTGPSDAGSDVGPADPCGDAPFCEKFDGYPSVTTISTGQRFGPWRAALQNGATMNLDGTHKLSGSSALHVHIDATVTAGGRLFAEGSQPIFANRPTHVYGRMMMYIDPNGTSVHWTFFGVNGNAEPNSPVTGRNASYILSSLPRQGMNTYSFVYGLQAQGSDQFRDCSSQSRTSMPSAWACIAFEMDSVARKLRMYKDGAVDPILSVDDRGTGCVAPTPVTTPWYGPAISQLFVGAWSFHPMNAPLDVWIDDVVVDTKPVTCPPP